MPLFEELKAEEEAKMDQYLLGLLGVPSSAVGFSSAFMRKQPLPSQPLNPHGAGRDYAEDPRALHKMIRIFAEDQAQTGDEWLSGVPSSDATHISGEAAPVPPRAVDDSAGIRLRRRALPAEIAALERLRAAADADSEFGGFEESEEAAQEQPGHCTAGNGAAMKTKDAAAVFSHTPAASEAVGGDPEAESESRGAPQPKQGIDWAALDFNFEEADKNAPADTADALSAQAPAGAGVDDHLTAAAALIDEPLRQRMGDMCDPNLDAAAAKLGEPVLLASSERTLPLSAELMFSQNQEGRSGLDAEAEAPQTPPAAREKSASLVFNAALANSFDSLPHLENGEGGSEADEWGSFEEVVAPEDAPSGLTVDGDFGIGVDSLSSQQQWLDDDWTALGAAQAAQTAASGAIEAGEWEDWPGGSGGFQAWDAGLSSAAVAGDTHQAVDVSGDISADIWDHLADLQLAASSGSGVPITLPSPDLDAGLHAPVLRSGDADSGDDVILEGFGVSRRTACRLLAQVITLPFKNASSLHRTGPLLSHERRWWISTHAWPTGVLKPHVACLKGHGFCYAAASCMQVSLLKRSVSIIPLPLVSNNVADANGHRSSLIPVACAGGCC